MEDFLKIASTDTIPVGTMSDADLEGHKFLIAHVGDQFYITDGHCAHMGGPLWKGELEGTVITCPWHGSQYDVRDGSCLRWTSWTGAALTAAALLRHPRPIRAYECRVEGSDILVGPQKPPGTAPE